MKTVYLIDFEIDVDADNYEEYATIALSDAAAFNSAYTRSRDYNASRYPFISPPNPLVLRQYATAMYPCRVVSQHRFPDSDSARSFMQRTARYFDNVATTLPVEFVHSACGGFAIDKTYARGVVAGQHAHEYHDEATSPLTFSWRWRYNSDIAAPNVAECLRTRVRSAKLATLQIASNALVEAMRTLWDDILHSENILRDTLCIRCGLGSSEASGWILVNQESMSN